MLWLDVYVCVCAWACRFDVVPQTRAAGPAGVCHAVQDTRPEAEGGGPHPGRSQITQEPHQQYNELRKQVPITTSTFFF